jgi:hypothetical protein
MYVLPPSLQATVIGDLSMTRRDSSRDPRRGLPSLAERRRTNFFVEPKAGASERDGPDHLPMGRHRFQIGQNVYLSLGAMQRGKSISCKIVKVLPFEGHYYQYRVKSTDEAFERIANEHELIALPSAF